MVAAPLASDRNTELQVAVQRALAFVTYTLERWDWSTRPNAKAMAEQLELELRDTLDKQTR